MRAPQKEIEYLIRRIKVDGYCRGYEAGLRDALAERGIVWREEIIESEAAAAWSRAFEAARKQSVDIDAKA